MAKPYPQDLPERMARAGRFGRRRSPWRLLDQALKDASESKTACACAVRQASVTWFGADQTLPLAFSDFWRRRGFQRLDIFLRRPTTQSNSCKWQLCARG